VQLTVSQKIIKINKVSTGTVPYLRTLNTKDTVTGLSDGCWSWRWSGGGI